jgi:hypothetical protein
VFQSDKNKTILLSENDITVTFKNVYGVFLLSGGGVNRLGLIKSFEV